MSKSVFTAEEIAARLGVNVVTIYRHLRSGKLPASKPGKSYIVTRDDLATYLGSLSRVEALFGRAGAE